MVKLIDYSCIIIVMLTTQFLDWWKECLLQRIIMEDLHLSLW